MNINYEEYNLIHAWLRRNHGSANVCLNIACKGKSSDYEYALKRGFNHEKNLNNYLTLCKTCHHEYDKDGKKWQRNSKNIQIRVSKKVHKRLSIYAAKNSTFIINVMDELIKKL